MGSLRGKTAMVTGGSRGIGRAVAQELARAGALVAVHYDGGEDSANDTISTIEAAGGRAFLVQSELGTPGDVDRLWAQFDAGQKAAGAEPGLDVLVNNAAFRRQGDLETITPEDFDKVLALNVKAPFFIVQKGLPRLRRGARILNVSSGVSCIAFPEMIAYCMARGALHTFSLTLAKVLAKRGITVESISPGEVPYDDAVSVAASLMASVDVRWMADQTKFLG